MRRTGIALLVVILMLGGCSFGGSEKDSAPRRAIEAHQVDDAVPRYEPILARGNKSPYTVLGKRYTVLDSAAGYRERGTASWYGRKFHGRKTSNGEIFDTYKATAAHRSLPIPTYVRVTNLNNQRSMIVRVNDRGPFHGNRLIDLSYGAAVKLGFAKQGTAPVLVETVSAGGRSQALPTVYRFVQVGAFSQRSAAQSLRDDLASGLSWTVKVSLIKRFGQRLYRVRIGPIDTVGQLREVQDYLENVGLGRGQPLP